MEADITEDEARELIPLLLSLDAKLDEMLDTLGNKLDVLAFHLGGNRSVLDALNTKLNY
jgi:hypothetical protein